MDTSQASIHNNKSIAVLPFVNMSSDPDNEYFSDGITEEIINALTGIEGLKVIARTSSFAFKGKNIDIRTIGSQLGITTVLEGSVRKVKNRVRITAQLVRTDDGSHLWSKNFDRELEDIFALQDEISLLIADRIRENFGHLEIGEQLVKAPDVNVDTYQIYLKGRYYLHKFNVNDIKQGIHILEQLTRDQPDFALAHVNIHYGYNMMAAGGLMPVEEALTKGKLHLDQALQLDDQLAECYHSLGWHSLNQDWDFTNATKYLMKAIDLRPGYADAHQKLFINLILEGKIESSFRHIEIARQLDPLAVLNNYFTGYYYYVVEEFEESNYYLERTFEIEASFIVGYSIYGLSLVMQNRAHYLLKKAETIPAMAGADIEKLIMQTLAYSSLNDTPNINIGLKKLRAALDGESRERVRFFLIFIETILKNYETALDLIEVGVANREPLLTLLKVDPLLKPLHQFERFQLALKEIYKLSDLELPQKQVVPISSLENSELAPMIRKLERSMQEEKAYLDSSLSLRTLAELIDIHPNKLSWLINEQIGKNFNEYINSYRLAAFKAKALEPSNSHLTLLALAYESGFNSKTVFNSFFKKSEGMTPRAWMKANQ
jgi:TolB-like protein/AraC-like DNA-binding protein